MGLGISTYSLVGVSLKDGRKTKICQALTHVFNASIRTYSLTETILLKCLVSFGGMASVLKTSSKFLVCYNLGFDS